MNNSNQSFIKRPRSVWSDKAKLKIIDSFNINIRQEQKAFVAAYNSVNEKKLNSTTFNQWLDPAYRASLIARIKANDAVNGAVNDDVNGDVNDDPATPPPHTSSKTPPTDPATPPTGPATPPPHTLSKIEITKIIKPPPTYLTGETYAACMFAFAQHNTTRDSNESISQIAVKGTQEVENDESVFTQKKHILVELTTR